jgi:hypothetical protein
MSAFSVTLAAASYFFVADLVYALDHYLVHHDRERFRRTHGRHHRRYNGRKDAPQLDAYELSTYGSAAVYGMMLMSALSLVTGNVGFFLGAVGKLVHSLVFHCYQHGWWGAVPARRQGLAPARRSWGLATAGYHAHHHSHPDDGVFTYAESWAGFDRLLEMCHPWLVKLTKDARAELVAAGRHA